MFERSKPFIKFFLVHNQIKFLQKKSIPVARFLSLENNLIETLNASMFIDIWYVEILNLNHNRIKMITASSLIGLNAFSLELNHNLIEDLEDRSIPEVEEMYINNNKLILIHSKMFVNISKTYKLDVSCNNITSFNFENSKLNALNMSYNQITYLSQNYFSGMKLLTNLSLSNNLISSLETKSIPLVTNLNLSYNLLTSIEANIFTDVDLLKSLDIKNNCIKYIDLKLAEKLIVSNRKLNEKCTLDVNRMTENLISKSAGFAIIILVMLVVVIAAIIITVYSRRLAKSSRHCVHLTNPDTPNAELPYDRVTNSVSNINNAVYVETSNEYEVVDLVINPMSNINDGEYVEATNEYEVVFPVTNSVSNIKDGEYVEATNEYEEINDIAVQRESYGYLVPRSAS
ncbi:PREDICTED: leucine-rich repeats and immunoglobulin-like domains protein 1 [Nicrophorus vespilloides]|uniref:Leucine-rich repeats and immunoglobulin-like domains protein 1 n=1 Tax=Nicrophorus vespilloides TaxID=110193 RepID=A0ABM1N813_NICVS|nr:PREDICTED: leucine-rich repeats and immunoglobulin-like domains protein 1 [Nicrophorus vespilloides]